MRRAILPSVILSLLAGTGFLVATVTADPPVFSPLIGAGNTTHLVAAVDDEKVLCWISGTRSYAGEEAVVRCGDVESSVIVQDGNLFTWRYRVDEPTTAVVRLGDMMRRLRLSPEEDGTRSAFFVVDRTVYRPGQELQFAGFLRDFDGREFHAVVDETVEVTIVSRRKKTTVARLPLTSDSFGRVAGEYRFSAADPLDDYDLRVAGFTGEASVKLAEFRKAKVKLNIDGEIEDHELKLTFQAVDFLGQPAAGTKVTYTVQVHSGGGERVQHTLAGDRFVHHVDSDPIMPVPDPAFASPDELLMWDAGIIERNPSWSSRTVVSRQGEIPIDGAGTASEIIPLEKEWRRGGYRIVVEGVLLDYNGREQRASKTLSIAAETKSCDLQLSLPRRDFGVSESIPISVRTLGADGTPVSAEVTVVAMKVVGRELDRRMFYGSYFNQHANARFRPLRRHNRRAWSRWDHWNHHGESKIKRELTTAIPLADGEGTLRLEEPGAYQLVCMATLPDGRKLRNEVGCIVRPDDSAPQFVLELEDAEISSGATLRGTIHSRFADAQVLLTLRDGGGLRLWETIELANGRAPFELSPPAGVGYGCSLMVHYVADDGDNLVVQEPVRIVPEDRFLNVEIRSEETYAPGEEVTIDIDVDPRGRADLVVSVFDESLLGIAPDRSVGVRDFYLADERAIRTGDDELLRRRLGGVTVEELVAEAKVLLAEDPELARSPRGSILANTVQHFEPGRHLNGMNVQALLSLAGIENERRGHFGEFAYGTNWGVYLDREPLVAEGPTPLYDVLQAETNSWRLQPFFAGSTLILVEYHTESLRRYAGHILNGSSMLMAGGYGLRGSARGDAHFSVSANGMFSQDIGVSGQSFISHLPVATQPAMVDGPDFDGEVRRDFSDLAHWQSHVRTDDAGHANVTFRLPDSLTNWRVVVTALTENMHVGQASARFRTFKPIMVWPMVPRIFTEGDVVKLYASVHNRSDEEQWIDVSLNCDNGEILTPAEVRVLVPPKGNQPVYWSFEAGDAGFTEILMSASCDAGRDASLKRLPVTRLAAEQNITASGFCTGRATLDVPLDVALDDAVLELTFAPRLIEDLLPSLDYLVQYPYGCVEQTMSRFLPAIKVSQILDRANIDTTGLKERLPEVAAAGIKRLLELQKEDGGWGWQGGSQTHEMMTPYALLGLLEAEKAGYEIPNEEAIAAGLRRLRYFIDGMGEQQAMDRIYCISVYALRENVTAEWWTFMESQVRAGSLSDYALALVLELASRRGKDDLAAAAAGSLHESVSRTSLGAHWSTAGFSRWGNDRFEITAAVLNALVSHDPADPMINDVLTYFANTKRGARWNSTKDTAMIILATCNYLGTQIGGMDAPQHIVVSINGGEPQRVEFQEGLVATLSISHDGLRHGLNHVDFLREAPQSLFRARLRHWKSGRDIAPLESGLTVERKFYLLDSDGRRRTQVRPGDAVPRGSYLQSEVTVSTPNPERLRFILVEDPKPASCEIIPAKDPRFRNHGSTGYALREERTSGVAFHHEESGSRIIDRSVLHVELAGEYAVPPARAELMYQTLRHGHSGSFYFVVEDDRKKETAAK